MGNFAENLNLGNRVQPPLYIEKSVYPPSGEPSASSCRGKLSLRCWAFAWLNDCTNGDEANFTFVQAQKTQNLY